MLENKQTNPFLKYLKRAKAELIVIVAVIFFDLLSKFLVSSSMEIKDRKQLIKKVLYLYYIKNPKAAFSNDFGLGDALGEKGARIFFIALMLAATIGFTIIMVRGVKKHFIYRLSLALIIGGALGNLYDRVVHKEVRDFVEIEYGGKTIMGQETFAVFNFADMALVFGVILFAVYIIYRYGKEQPGDEESEDETSKEEEQAEA